MGGGIRESRICATPFYSIVINPDGEVSACCPDWERNIVLGSVYEESLYDIWNGERHNGFLKAMLSKGRRDCCITCGMCEYPNYDCVDNIDDYAEQILKKYK